MLGLFGALDLAKRSLATQMQGVETAGQNIANINTPGYSRQRVDITTSIDLPGTAGPVGTGSQVVRIQQIVSELLNSQVRSNNSTLGFQQGRQSALDSAQSALAEFLNNADGTSGSGLSAQLNDFFSSLQSVAAAPNSAAARQTLIGAAENLSTSFNQVSRQFTELKTGLNDSLARDTSSANELLGQIASLNAQIANAEFTGGTANDLRDKRSLALENLASLVNFTTSSGTYGEVNIAIGGQAIVTGRQLVDTLKTYDAGGGQMLLQTATGGVNLAVTGGRMAGTIDARDTDLATMRTQLDSLASNLISAVNSVHSAGFSPSGTTGANFFNGTDAASISVNTALANNPLLIQTASSATATSDNSVALQLTQLAQTAQAGLGGQTFSQFYSRTVAALGSALNQANTQVTNQETVAKMLSEQRGAVSGVNLDEEMTSLMSFQRAYTASAQLLTTVDEMIQTTLAMKR